MDKGGINVWRNYCNADKIRLCGIFNFIHVYVGKLKIKKILTTKRTLLHSNITISTIRLTFKLVCDKITVGGV